MSRTSRFRPRLLLLSAVLSVPLAGACGGDLTDQAAERIAEADGAGDVEIDTGGGRVEITTEDGSLVAEAGGDLPEGWPDDVPLPTAYTIENAGTMDAGTGPVQTVILRTEGEPLDVFEQLEGGFSGWTEDSRTVSGSGFAAVVMVQYSKDGRTVSVTATEGTGDTVVNYVVSALSTP